MFGPSAVEELNDAASLSLVMNTDCQMCLRNFAHCSLLQSQLKERAAVVDSPKQCDVEVGGCIRPFFFITTMHTCVNIGKPAHIQCRLLAGIKEANKCSPFTLSKPNDIIYFGTFKR